MRRRRRIAGTSHGPGRRRSGDVAGRPGFTLVELIVVFAILAVIAAATAPALRLGDREEAALDAATRQLSALFRMARDSAVRGAAPVTVVLDPRRAAFWLDVEERGAPLSMEGVGRRPGELGAVRRTAAEQPEMTEPTPLGLPAGVRIESQSRLRFTFRMNGSVFGDTIVVRSAAGMRFVHLNPWTGDVVVQ